MKEYSAICIGAACCGSDQKLMVIVSGIRLEILLNEDTARHLADQILATANFIWPVKEADK